MSSGVAMGRKVRFSLGLALSSTFSLPQPLKGSPPLVKRGGAKEGSDQDLLRQREEYEYELNYLGNRPEVVLLHSEVILVDVVLNNGYILCFSLGTIWGDRSGSKRERLASFLRGKRSESSLGPSSAGRIFIVKRRLTAGAAENWHWRMNMSSGSSFSQRGIFAAAVERRKEFR